MVFTNDDYLPTYEELTVPDIELTSSVLRAGAVHYGKYCDTINKEFMLCWSEEKDPRKCLSEGKEVTKCAFEFFGKVKRDCYDAFTDHWKCIDDGVDPEMHPDHCRKTQKVFDQCIKEKFGQDRPPIGYFSKVRKHTTSRQKIGILPHNLPPAPTDSIPFGKV